MLAARPACPKRTHRRKLSPASAEDSAKCQSYGLNPCTTEFEKCLALQDLDCDMCMLLAWLAPRVGDEPMSTLGCARVSTQDQGLCNRSDTVIRQVVSMSRVPPTEIGDSGKSEVND